MTWRNSLEARHDRIDRRIAPEPPPAVGSPDLKHCLAVVRALDGRGFPYCRSTIREHAA